MMKTRALLPMVAVLFAAVLLFSGCSSLMDMVTGESSENETTEEKASERQKTEEAAETAEKAVEKSKSGTPGNTEIVGTWINPDYDGKGRSGMLVYEKLGVGSYAYKAYDNSDGSGNVYEGTVVYQETWTDGEGRRMGRSSVSLNNGMSWVTLECISADGSTLEVQPGVDEINPNGARYSIYYRK
jgi:uncharacterized protein YceK